MKKSYGYTWNLKDEERGRNHANTIPTNHTLLQNPEVVGFLSNYMAHPDNDMSMGLYELGRIYPLTAEPGEEYNYGWTPQRFADLINKYKQMLKKNSEYTNAKNKAMADRDRAYSAAAKKQVVQAGMQNIGRGKYLRHSYLGGINMRKAYPNELTHGTTVRINSPKDAANMRARQTANRSDYNHFRGLIEKAINSGLLNAGQISVLKSSPQALMKFAQQQRQSIKTKSNAFDDNYRHEMHMNEVRGNVNAARTMGTNRAQYKAAAGKSLGLTDAEWAAIEHYAKVNGFTY